MRVKWVVAAHLLDTKLEHNHICISEMLTDVATEPSETYVKSGEEDARVGVAECTLKVGEETSLHAAEVVSSNGSLARPLATYSSKEERLSTHEWRKYISNVAAHSDPYSHQAPLSPGVASS
jgi:hypothetical protein